jgi:structural maintenance of chromosome 2
MIVMAEYKQIKTKRALIEKDKLSINTVIEKLEKKKYEIFIKSLKRLNSIFQNIFSSLLPGYFAKIISVKSKEGLFVGLNFRLSKREFKKKVLFSLSGGQKSILALSFIFSLLILKPCPFYILDEIDAALDFYHTQNIGKMIRNYFTIAQFIIVTLKKGFIISSNLVFEVKLVKGRSLINRHEK